MDDPVGVRLVEGVEQRAEYADCALTREGPLGTNHPFEGLAHDELLDHEGGLALIAEVKKPHCRGVPQSGLGSRLSVEAGVEALQRVTDALLNFMIEEPNELRAMYLLRYASIDPSAEYRANVARVNRAHIRALAAWVEEGQGNGEIITDIDPRLAAELFASAIDGLLYRWLVSPDIPIAELQAILRRSVRQSLTAP